MGTEMGHSNACFFMGYFQMPATSTTPLHHTHTHTLLQQYKESVPEIYKRYIDHDIVATSMSYNQLLDFINFVQNFQPVVKFTFEMSEESVTFQDMNISLKQGKLTTFVHYKATDSLLPRLPLVSQPQYQKQHPVSQSL